MTHMSDNNRRDALGRYRGAHRARSTRRGAATGTFVGGSILAAAIGFSAAGNASAETAKPSYKSFADGHGGTTTVKTRTDGSVVKTSADGSVLYDSNKSAASKGSTTSTGASDAATGSSNSGKSSTASSAGTVSSGTKSASSNAGGNSSGADSHSSAAGATSGSASASKPTYKSFTDGNGGTTTVKTRTDGSVVKTAADGTVLYDSNKSAVAQHAQSGATSSSVTSGKPEASATSQSASTNVGLSGNDVNNAISQAKKTATGITAANVVARGDAGAILNTPAGSAIGKEKYSAAAKAAGVNLPDGVNKVLGGVAVVKSGQDFVKARESGDYLGAMRAELNGGTALAGMAGAGPAATAVNYVGQASLTVGDKANTYTKDTTAVQDWQTKTGQDMYEGKTAAVIGDVMTNGYAVAKGAVQKAFGVDPATNAQQASKSSTSDVTGSSTSNSGSTGSSSTGSGSSSSGSTGSGNTSTP